MNNLLGAIQQVVDNRFVVEARPDLQKSPQTPAVTEAGVGSWQVGFGWVPAFTGDVDSFDVDSRDVDGR